MKRIAGLTFSLIVVSLIINFLSTRPKIARAQTGGSLATQLSQLKAGGLMQVGDQPQSATDIQELYTIFAATVAAVQSVPASPNAGAEKRAIDNQLRQELDSFATNNPTSAWTPSVDLLLARRAQLRCAYSLALQYYQNALEMVAGSRDRVAQQIAAKASGGVAKLLALTGRIDDLNVLEAQMSRLNIPTIGPEWSWAREMREWGHKHPEESYKCGLYCLDQLGRLTQMGNFRPKDITENKSSLQGSTAADLLNIAAKAGLQIRAVLITDTGSLPVPSILHLRSEHFVVVREQRGAFYEVYDPVAFGAKWLTVQDLSSEMSGCALIANSTATIAGLAALDDATAAQFRGRCHNPIPPDHQDDPCSPSDDPCSCPPGGPPSGGPPPGSNPPGGPPPGGPPPGGCSFCNGGQRGAFAGGGAMGVGMANWFVSEAFLNLWVEDTPLQYRPAYGPEVKVRLAFHDRAEYSVVSQLFWHGAELGNSDGLSLYGVWSCSLLSFAELDTSENTVDLMMPGGGWATFNFPSGSSVSAVEYRSNTWLEKQGPPGGITNLVLHYSDGSTSGYGTEDSSVSGYAGLFYISKHSDPRSNSTLFSYDSNFHLTIVTAADGTTFTLHYDLASQLPDCVTSVTTSYGASASFTYYSDGNGNYRPTLASITDAAGITSRVDYQASGYGGPLVQIITPYGTTALSTAGNGNPTDPQGIFDRTVQITNANGTKEFYGMLNTYAGSSWPPFSTNQIPTNTPLGTLDDDSTNRQERNTFYWNAQQFAELGGTDPLESGWPQFKLARIRHWLAATFVSGGQPYTHFAALSVEQAPSPDGGATEGQLTWYDYTNKPAGVDYEIGTQIMPTVIAKVMPDTSTWCEFIQRLTNGLPTQTTETWVDGGMTLSRKNTFTYAPNGVDMVAWTNALGILSESNVFNLYHQVCTNYDALGQPTTYTYDPATLQLTSSSFPSGLTSTNIYGSDHHLQSTVDLQINRTNTFTWNADGTVQSKTDPRGLTVDYFWDGLHRLSGALFPDGTTTSNRYDIISGVPYPNSTGGTMLLDLTATKDRLGYWTYFAYDALRREIYETNANNVVTAYGYCDCGAVNSKTNALGTTVEQPTVYLLDYQANLIATLNADGYNVTNTYDSLGRRTMTTDGWKTNWFNYDNVGLVTSVSNACGVEQSSTFDLLDRTVYFTDVNGVTSTNSFDALNRLLSRGYPDGGIEKFGYTARGLAAYTNQLGFPTLYAYDAGGRKTFETNANSQVLAYTNTPAGDLLSLTDGNNQTTRWNYDVFGHVTNKVVQGGTVILTYAYDLDDRLTNRWSAAKGTTSYYYDPVGNVTNITYPSIPAVSFSYDPLNRMTNMVDALGTNNYAYTLGNQLLTDDGPFANDTITNTYVNRLRTKFIIPTWGSPASSWTNSFSYDTADRFSMITSPAGTFQYSYPVASASRLTSRITLPDSAYVTNSYDIDVRLTTTALKTSSGTTLDSAAYGYNRGNQRTNFLKRAEPTSCTRMTKSVS